jgi:demethylmenaquinone methyltransferase/2-methoxy-6-polyprenyl-1,4-benzoquinol methylase
MSLVSMIIADRMESLTKYYDRWMTLITFGQDERVRDAVLSYIEPGDRVLDVGCGTGTLAVKSAQKRAQVIAIDQSPAMLKLAREKAQASGIEVDFRLAQAQSLNLNGKFDVVTATFTLGEISPDEAEMVVADLAEHLKPGGKMIVADEARPTKAFQHIVSGFQRAIVALLTFLIIEERPTRLHNLRAMLETAGLAVTTEQLFQGGALRLVVAERRGPVVKPKREILEPVLHSGLKGFVWDLLCWLFILPLAVRSGLYRIGNPTRDSPLLLTSNFYMTFKQVVKALQGRHCWLLVEDTEGWNVWCATDARIFSAEKAAALMRAYDVDSLLNHKTIVVPRLGGRIARRLSELTALRPALRRSSGQGSGQGWRVIKGPIEARDLPAFIEGGLVATRPMRSLRRYYSLPQRLRVGTLTLLVAIVCALPFLFVLREFLSFFLIFGLVSSFVLAIFHYWIPGRTGVVKELLFAALAFIGLVCWTVAQSRPLTPRLGWVMLTLLTYSFVLGYMYQGSTPVIYWKRVWR